MFVVWARIVRRDHDQLVMSCTSPMPQRGWANQPWILRFLSVFDQPMSAMRDRRCPKMSERHVRSWPVFKCIEDRVAIFRAKAETRGILITSLSSAPACKFSMPGDTQVLSAVQHEAMLKKKARAMEMPLQSADQRS